MFSVDLSALKAGSLYIRPRPTILKNVVSEVMYLSQPLIGRKNLHLIDDTVDLPQMNVDEARILQVCGLRERIKLWA